VSAWITRIGSSWKILATADWSKLFISGSKLLYLSFTITISSSYHTGISDTTNHLFSLSTLDGNSAQIIAEAREGISNSSCT
jgi:hypothetical protein